MVASTEKYRSIAERVGDWRFGHPPFSSGSSVVQNRQLLFVDHCSSLVERSANWQAIETRTNGTASSDVSAQTVWSAAYVNAAVLQDAYSGGVIQPNSRIYFQQDANWNTTAVVGYNSTTGSWQVTQRYAYSPYGTITVLNADWSTPPVGTTPMVNNLYQGMSYDAVTGLYYARARWYSPSLGTWISQDPLQYINGANTYQFVTSNPVGISDPSGLLFGIVHHLCFGMLKDIIKDTKSMLKAMDKAGTIRQKINTCPHPHGLELAHLIAEETKEYAEAVADAAKIGAMMGSMRLLGCHTPIPIPVPSPFPNLHHIHVPRPGILPGQVIIPSILPAPV